MRLSSVWLMALFGLLAASSVIFNRFDFSKRSLSALAERDAAITDLVKRKGGGGGGKTGSSGGSTSSGSSSGGKTGGSTSGTSSTGSSGGSRGGTTASGSGAPRSYGGGGYYGGGAATPYAAGGRSPRGLAPASLLGIGALGAFGFGGLWLAGAYLYSYPRPYGFYNATAQQNQSKPVNCLCQQYNPCGCDDNDDPAYYNSVIGDGDPSKLNQSLVRVADVNGTSQIFLNGTLPNDTTAAGAVSLASAAQLGSMTGALALALAVASALFSL